MGYREPDKEAVEARDVAALEKKLTAANSRADKAEKELRRIEQEEGKHYKKALFGAKITAILPVTAWLSYFAYNTLSSFHFPEFACVLAVLTVCIPGAIGFIVYLNSRYG